MTQEKKMEIREMKLKDKEMKKKIIEINFDLCACRIINLEVQKMRRGISKGKEADYFATAIGQAWAGVPAKLGKWNEKNIDRLRAAIVQNMQIVFNSENYTEDEARCIEAAVKARIEEWAVRIAS